MRNNRTIKNWTADKVEDAIVANHRYRFDGTLKADGSTALYLDECDSYESRQENIPYAVGEVVYVTSGIGAVRARIVNRGWSSDRYGERREWYNIQRETKKGLWSKIWDRTHPGYIQRGYQRMGLAPEMPTEK